MATAYQLCHGGLGVTHHRHANAVEKPVIASFAASDGLVVDIPGRFGNTGQERFRQDVYEREQRLLSYPQIVNSSGYAIQTRGDSVLRSIDAALTAG